MRHPVNPVVGRLSVALTDRVTYWTLVLRGVPAARVGRPGPRTLLSLRGPLLPDVPGADHGGWRRSARAFFASSAPDLLDH